MNATLRLPGLIDPHVHLRDPGQIEKEDFFSGTSAALAGGFTTVIDMPNNKVPITSDIRLNEKIAIARQKAVCDIGFYFGSLGDNLEEFKKVKKKVKGLKLFLNQTTGNYLLDKKHLKEIFKTWPQNLPILVHAEVETFDDVLEVLQKNPRKLHLCHMSTAYELKKVMKAKKDGLPVTCGVTPHHLFLTEKDLKTLQGFGMMKPPLRSLKDVNFLWKHLSSIDCIESDHAPHTKEEKKADPPSFGVSGLETTLPLLLTAVRNNKLTIDDIVRLCHDRPASIFNLATDKNTYIEVDMKTTFEIKNEKLFSKCKWTPFNSWKVKGKILQVTLRGKKVFENDQILALAGSGKII